MGKSRKHPIFVVGRDINIEKMFKERSSYTVFKEGKERPDLLVFSGGPDVDPGFYQEKPLPDTRVSKDRDDLDFEYFNRWEGIPKVGICRGAQFLNVMSGGQLWQDVDNHNIGEHEMINLLDVPGRYFQKKLRVTSTHHQMMIPGPDGHVLGIASNQTKTSGISTKYISAKKREVPRFDPEIVWYPKTNSLCFQFHPEYQGSWNYLQKSLFFEMVEYFFWV